MDKIDTLSLDSQKRETRSKSIKPRYIERGLLSTPETSGRLSTSIQRFNFWDRLGNQRYNWPMVSKVTVNQLQLAKITQTIPKVSGVNN